MTDPWQEPLTDVLQEMGHSDEEIRKILLRVAEYDRDTAHDSIMDSIGSGEIDLAALIKEALRQ